LIIAGPQDEADIRQKLGEARNTSFAVHAVASLSAAFQEIAKNSVDVFVIDLAVPDSDGIPGLQRLIAVAKNTPVIILTSVHDPSQALEVVRAGADDYVVRSRMNATAYERVLSYAIERHGVRRQSDLQLAVSRVLQPQQSHTRRPCLRSGALQCAIGSWAIPVVRNGVWMLCGNSKIFPGVTCH
jgi:DNA-binding response OmpR family regulator